MSTTFRPQVRRHPAGDAVPQIDVEQKNKEARTSSGFTVLVERAMQEILAVTYWFDPAPHPGPYPIIVKFSGHRVDVKGRLSAKDRFVQDETIEEIVPGSGPISLTARIRNINPGSWVVTAHQLPSAHPAHKRRKEQENITAAASRPDPTARFWREWAPSIESVEHIRTCPTPFVRVPGIFPGMWAAMATLGIVVALTLQSLVIFGDHLVGGPWWVVSLGAIVAGIVGAKVWYIVLYRREHLVNGWCIQGFITGAILAAAFLLVILKVPVGVFLDATAPGLLFAMAVGRVGCFFAGCCGGPPTAARFGVWSSDQRVGARRIPTQLLESALAGMLGIVELMIVLGHGPAGGTLFAIGLSAYTLVRQGILHLRAEPRKTRFSGQVTAILSVLVLVAAIVSLAR